LFLGNWKEKKSLGKRPYNLCKVAYPLCANADFASPCKFRLLPLQRGTDDALEKRILARGWLHMQAF
jgi:hypothetical protein